MIQTEAPQLVSAGDGREPSQLAAASPHHHSSVGPLLKDGERHYAPRTLELNFKKQ